MVKIELLNNIEGLGEDGSRIELPVSSQDEIDRTDTLKKARMIKEL